MNYNLEDDEHCVQDRVEHFLAGLKAEVQQTKAGELLLLRWLREREQEEEEAAGARQDAEAKACSYQCPEYELLLDPQKVPRRPLEQGSF